MWGLDLILCGLAVYIWRRFLRWDDISCMHSGSLAHGLFRGSYYLYILISVVVL